MAECFVCTCILCIDSYISIWNAGSCKFNERESLFTILMIKFEYIYDFGANLFLVFCHINLSYFTQ